MTSGRRPGSRTFHSISSFNNAGFALYTDNLIGFVDDPFICLPIAAAIILGGLGFPVILQLRKEFTRPLHWSMNTKLVLWGTVVLLALGTVYITALEWGNAETLGKLDPWGRILAGFFQSVQTRTAGFNSRGHRPHARRDVARHGHPDVHRRRPRRHCGRHQGDDIRGAVLHHDDRAAR